MRTTKRRGLLATRVSECSDTIMKTSKDIVRKDLDYIVGDLKDEFVRMAGKKMLITGGAGFLGYYLVQAISHWNQSARQTDRIHMTVYDNYLRGVPEWLRKLEGNADLTLVKRSIIEPLPPDVGDFQFVIHAAGIASPTYYRAHPIETMDANVGGLRNLLEYCRKQKEIGRHVEGFLFFSSSEIYGDPDPGHIPTSETYRGYVSCTGPRACYDESKRYGETLCVNFARQFDLPIRVARPFNNYGPGLKLTDRRVIPDFARDVLAGRDIVMFSDGSPTRTFCYVADAVVGYYKVLLRGRNGEAYNIGVEEPEISTLDLATRLANIGRTLFGYQGKVVHEASLSQDYLADNPNRRCPVIAKARDELAYNPSFSLDEGLTRSLIWYRDHREGEEA